MAKKTKNTTKYTFKTPAAVQKGFRAYVGLFGAAYERAVPVFEKATKNYDDYAARGEKLETSATSFVKDTSKTVTDFAAKRYEMRAAKVRAFFPKAANISAVCNIRVKNIWFCNYYIYNSITTGRICYGNDMESCR